MGNSNKNKTKIIEANQVTYRKHTGQTVADAGASARRAIAITRNGLEAAKGIHIRA